MATQTTQVSLCVAVQRLQAAIKRGQSAQWAVSAWTRGGSLPDATVRLTASPASVTPEFSFGCGSHDGTSSCDLGAVDVKSSQRQLEAQVAIAAASTVMSVRLTVTGSAAHLSKDPVASATVAVSATAASTSSTSAPITSTSPIPASNLPYLPGTTVSPTLSPGGNAAGLFPALTPSHDPSGKPGQKANTRTAANASTPPLGAPVVGAQLIGLGVLALAFVLAVTRLSVRRRPALAPSGPVAPPIVPAPPTAPAPAASPTPAASATPPAQPPPASVPPAEPRLESVPPAGESGPAGSGPAGSGPDQSKPQD